MIKLTQEELDRAIAAGQAYKGLAGWRMRDSSGVWKLVLVVRKEAWKS